MKISIASGKGGTGKTTVAVNLAYTLALSGKRVRLLVCDVEGPNDHLFVRPDIAQSRPVHRLKPVLGRINAPDAVKAPQPAHTMPFW